MNQEEILEYNIRCAEFLEWDYNKLMDRWNEDMLHQYSFVESIELKFHSDWNWIMEVVDAIEKLSEHYTTSIHSDVFDKGDEHKMFIFNNEGEIIVGENGKTKKEAVVQAINQFLIWYEKQTTNEQQ